MRKHEKKLSREERLDLKSLDDLTCRIMRRAYRKLEKEIHEIKENPLLEENITKHQQLTLFYNKKTQLCDVAGDNSPSITRDKQAAISYPTAEALIIAINLTDGFGDIGNNLNLLRSLQKHHANYHYTFLSLCLPHQTAQITKMLSAIAFENTTVIIHACHTAPLHYLSSITHGPGLLDDDAAGTLKKITSQASIVFSASVLFPEQVNQLRAEEFIARDVKWFYVDDAGNNIEEIFKFKDTIIDYPNTLHYFSSGFRGLGLAFSELIPYFESVKIARENPSLLEQLAFADKNTLRQTLFDDVSVACFYLNTKSEFLIHDLTALFAFTNNKKEMCVFCPGASVRMFRQSDYSGHPDPDPPYEILGQAGIQKIYVNGNLWYTLSDENKVFHTRFEQQDRSINFVTARIENKFWKALWSLSVDKRNLGTRALALVAASGGASFAEAFISDNAIPAFYYTQPYQEKAFREQFIALLNKFNNNAKNRGLTFPGFENLIKLFAMIQTGTSSERQFLGIGTLITALHYLADSEIRTAWKIFYTYLHENLDMSTFLQDFSDIRVYNSEEEDEKINALLVRFISSGELAGVESTLIARSNLQPNVLQSQGLFTLPRPRFIDPVLVQCVFEI